MFFKLNEHSPSPLSYLRPLLRSLLRRQIWLLLKLLLSYHISHISSVSHLLNKTTIACRGLLLGSHRHSYLLFLLLLLLLYRCKSSGTHYKHKEELSHLETPKPPNGMVKPSSSYFLSYNKFIHCD